MKTPHEMTPVELLSEFARNHEYHEAVAEARAWMASEAGKTWEASAGPLVLNMPGGGRSLPWYRVGHPLGEVREPHPDEEARWAELCAEINRRFR